MRRITWIICLPLMLSIGSSSHADPMLRKDEPLSEFNKALLDSGWTAVIDDETLDDGTLRSAFGDAGAILNAGFTAIQECSGTGKNFCIFRYRKGKDCLQVTTTGEYVAGLGEPGIWNWSTACRDGHSRKK